MTTIKENVATRTAAHDKMKSRFALSAGNGEKIFNRSRCEAVSNQVFTSMMYRSFIEFHSHNFFLPSDKNKCLKPDAI